MNLIHWLLDKMNTAFLIPNWMAYVAIALAAWKFLATAKEQAEAVRAKQGKITALESKAENEPEKVRYAWDLAQIKLEDYLDRNLYQVRWIFYLAASAMVLGFGAVVWGIHAVVVDSTRVSVAVVASASGVLTQFIGLTFMVLYKSTMLQATQYMSILERINAVGMAVNILDAIKDEAGSGLKDQSRTEIIRLLLTPASSSDKK